MGESLLELVKVLATPIVVGIFGLLLLRRIEGIKSEVAKQSDFHKKWAEQFFGCCQEFMQALERHLSVLTFVTKNPNYGMASELNKEVSQLTMTIMELQVRINRCVIFAGKTEPDVTQAADHCFKLLSDGLASKKLNVEEILRKMNEFNIAARKAHEEMLGLSDKRK